MGQRRVAPTGLVESLISVENLGAGLRAAVTSGRRLDPRLVSALSPFLEPLPLCIRVS